MKRNRSAFFDVLVIPSSAAAAAAEVEDDWCKISTEEEEEEEDDAPTKARRVCVGALGVNAVVVLTVAEEATRIERARDSFIVTSDTRNTNRAVGCGCWLFVGAD